MRKRLIIGGTLLITILLGVYVYHLLVEELPRMPPPPPVPAEVLSVWKSPPSPQGFPPDIRGEVTLQPYSSFVKTPSFFLPEGQWVDILVTSHLPIYVEEREPGSIRVRFKSEAGFATWSDPDHDLIFSPFVGKWHYKNAITVTDVGHIYTTAIRAFAWDGAMSYYLEFCNFDPNRQVEITYEVYRLAITPNWGLNSPYDTQLDLWLKALHHEYRLPPEEITQAYEKWIEQFK
ncbi:hypothetical protein M1N58_01030 [Dehalococcoidales bacterium]|nr:hypothetical protein [Dehalococcoidales bacterium]